MKITGTTIINILCSVSAICAVESSSGEINHFPVRNWQIAQGTSGTPRGWASGFYKRELDVNDLVLGKKDSAFHFQVSKGTEAGKILLVNHSTQPLEYRLQVEGGLFKDRWLTGVLRSNGKFTTDAKEVKVFVKKPVDEQK
ncbi:hypothetical protein PCANC_15548 [Puccinia coronata f. sp. avenae]|uniref:Uncharacterized protein n=1 Tax=Puccinia coronata f. sp. avenae TaxID=200324 RepID=A0A2N5SX70_9BASI|nr:hypothetical protein PCANC_15548 [Puccinia coronata f. sp. avenae]